MAHPLVWPGKYFFYPIGNTSAVCMTRDVALEEDASILLLGCGDPRNVLYTVSCEPKDIGRKLDFTCCDIDPAVLARNVLLFTMVSDQLSSSMIWNIFFHMYLDKNSYGILIDQCRKLIRISESVELWDESPYGRYLKISTAHTLSELRRHWILYVDFESLPPPRAHKIREAFVKVSKVNSAKRAITSARSAGPVLSSAMPLLPELFVHYWKNGVTFTNSMQIGAATLLNPTFVYSLGGEGISVHYGTDPVAPFHLAPLFGNARKALSISDVVKAAMVEFEGWCSSLFSAISSSGSPIPIIRFIVGDAIAVCRALKAFETTGSLDIGVPVAQWKTQLIQLSRKEYIAEGAPVIFNVIDTSNLNDHIGLLNVLIATVPILSTPSGVLYTESLLFRGEDATKEFTELLYADVAIIALLIGLCPVDYLSGFTSRCNTHELVMHRVSKNMTQFHQVTTWKPPASGDGTTSSGRPMCLYTFDSHQLGTLLYDIYHLLFEQEDAMNFWQSNQNNLLRALAASNIIHYSRESFVLFLKLIRDKLNLDNERWTEIMDRFFDLKEADRTLKMDENNSQDFYAQLHRQNVYSVSFYKLPVRKIGRFRTWENVPVVVRIVLIVPRHHLAILEDMEEKAGTPPLQCDVRGTRCHNIFTSIHAAFGRAIAMGTSSRPWVQFEEDLQGWKGSSSLVVSFTMPAFLLAEIEDPSDLFVRLGLRSTQASTQFIPKLGLELCLFSARFMDESQVHVLPEQQQPRTTSTKTSLAFAPSTIAQIGDVESVVVELDEQCELVASLVARISVKSVEAKALFQGGTSPDISQTAPCVMRITLEAYMQDVVYPFPVVGSKNRARLARKSLYIEIIVPISGALKPDGMRLNPFPVVPSGVKGHLQPWSLHRLDLSSLTILDIKAKGLDKWLNPHVGSMMSASELSLRKKRQVDVMMFIKDTIHTIFVRSSGIQGGSRQRVFSLHDAATKNCDTVFFISEMRFDVSSHTMVCDAYVLPLTKDVMVKIEKDFGRVVSAGTVTVETYEGEMAAWKRLLPAFAERCRTNWKHTPNCEYKARGMIPLTEEMEKDPLCSCGRGKDVSGMVNVPSWRNLAPHVTRIALSPLYAVSYLETVGRDPMAYKCSTCRGKGKPKLKECTGCRKVRYCSEACQKKDWKAHKPRCKNK
ncbi:hypothetical protein OF83DRAFT_1058096 [Amylostereum chailletii]|nr:hypothetical protein OF83DRAFT_1058096 [Amylostereum chailletii]